MQKVRGRIFRQWTLSFNSDARARLTVMVMNYKRKKGNHIASCASSLEVAKIRMISVRMVKSTSEAENNTKTDRPF